MTTKENIQRITEAASELGILPGDRASLQFSDPLILTFHGKTYSEATKIFRRFAIHKRNKTILLDTRWLEGINKDGLKVVVFINDLPPMCRIEEYVEKVAKQETKDTGEFIEVQRKRVVCSDNGRVQVQLKP